MERPGLKGLALHELMVRLMRGFEAERREERRERRERRLEAEREREVEREEERRRGWMEEIREEMEEDEKAGVEMVKGDGRHRSDDPGQKRKQESAARTEGDADVPPPPAFSRRSTYPDVLNYDPAA